MASTRARCRACSVPCWEAETDLTLTGARPGGILEPFRVVK
jgi:hypothetical protein